MTSPTCPQQRRRNACLGLIQSQGAGWGQGQRRVPTAPLALLEEQAALQVWGVGAEGTLLSLAGTAWHSSGPGLAVGDLTWQRCRPLSLRKAWSSRGQSPSPSPRVRRPLLGSWLGRPGPLLRLAPSCLLGLPGSSQGSPRSHGSGQGKPSLSKGGRAWETALPRFRGLRGQRLVSRLLHTKPQKRQPNPPVLGRLGQPGAPATLPPHPARRGGPRRVNPAPAGRPASPEGGSCRRPRGAPQRDASAGRAGGGPLGGAGARGANGGPRGAQAARRALGRPEHQSRPADLT